MIKEITFKDRNSNFMKLVVRIPEDLQQMLNVRRIEDDVVVPIDLRKIISIVDAKHETPKEEVLHTMVPESGSSPEDKVSKV
jgi:antitoxin component of MazEF toxin-antitoxin module